MSIVVCPLSKSQDLVESFGPSRIVSLLDPGSSFPDFGSSYGARHLRLAFHDAHLAEDGVVLPSPGHVEQLLTFLTSWQSQGTLLVHCRAGIGRSTATGFVATCWGNPHVAELEVARDLRDVAKLARPNETLVALADQAMGRDGRMSEAISVTGRGLPWIEVNEGLPFEMPQYPAHV